MSGGQQTQWEVRVGIAWGSEEELVSLHFRGTRAKTWVYTRMGETWAQTVRAVLTEWMEGSGWGGEGHPQSQ